MRNFYFNNKNTVLKTCKKCRKFLFCLFLLHFASYLRGVWNWNQESIFTEIGINKIRNQPITTSIRISVKTIKLYQVKIELKQDKIQNVGFRIQ